MNRKENTTEIGAFNLADVSVDFVGEFEIHVPLEKTGTIANQILNECMEKYSRRYPNIDLKKDVLWDFSIVLSLGFDNPEFAEYMAAVYIWQNEDDDSFERYDGYVLNLTEESKRKIKKMIWDKLGEVLFHI